MNSTERAKQKFASKDEFLKVVKYFVATGNLGSVCTALKRVRTGEESPRLCGGCLMNPAEREAGSVHCMDGLKGPRWLTQHNKTINNEKAIDAFMAKVAKNLEREKLFPPQTTQLTFDFQEEG